MAYLIKNDFCKIITSSDFEALINSTNFVWESAEVSALEEVKSYLRNRFDVESEFDYQIHDPSLSYTEGDRVIIQNGSLQGVFVALQDVAANTPITAEAFWRNEDNRNPKMTTVVALIVLYENYTRLNGTEIPNWLQLRYDGGDVRQMGGVIGYLKMIQRGTVEPNLPLLPDIADGTNQSGNRLAFGLSDTSINRNTTI